MDLARPQTGQHAAVAESNRPQRGVISHYAEDNIMLLGHSPWRGRPGGALGAYAVSPSGRAVEDRQAVAGLKQIVGHGQAHAAEADETDGGRHRLIAARLAHSG